MLEKEKKSSEMEVQQKLRDEVTCIDSQINKVSNESTNKNCMLIKKENEKVFIVSIAINKSEQYYLADFDFSLSKNKRDAVIFLKENNAYRIASIVEKKYSQSLGNVIREDLSSVIY